MSSIVELEEFLNITGNASLLNIDGLSNLSSVGFSLSITSNEILENIDGLTGLTFIDGDLLIERNPIINNLNSLSNLLTVSGDISIQGNTNLKSFCGLRPLLLNDGLGGIFYEMQYNRFNTGSVGIRDGECERDVPLDIYSGGLRFRTQNDVDFFSSMGFEGIEGGFIINSNGISEDQKITSLEGLSSIRFVTSNLYISDSDLSNLSGLENIEQISNLTIYNNPLLSDYCAIVLLAQSGSFENLNISNNLYNPSLKDLEVGFCTE